MRVQASTPSTGHLDPKYFNENLEKTVLSPRFTGTGSTKIYCMENNHFFTPALSIVACNTDKGKNNDDGFKNNSLLLLPSSFSEAKYICAAISELDFNNVKYQLKFIKLKSCIKLG